MILIERYEQGYILEYFVLFSVFIHVWIYTVQVVRFSKLISDDDIGAFSNENNTARSCGILASKNGLKTILVFDWLLPILAS